MNISAITARIEAAAGAAGRDPSSVTLIAVSKVQPQERVEAVLAAGHRTFGENRVQEAQGKWPAWRARFAGIQLHLIGPLQTNKLKPALEIFDAIHTLDREKLARMLADEVQRRGICPELFIQVNTGAEPQKAGVLPGEADRFIKTCQGTFHLALSGLMAIPPEGEDPKPHFALLAELARRNGLTGLSMGMSGDFELAIAMGATHVRVGSALFGPRVAPIG
jgi:pyridoxal phosphate enzyme (YggS family)